MSFKPKMDIVDKLRTYQRGRSGYAEYCHRAADEIVRLRLALQDASSGLDLAYSALEKGCSDEAMLHCGSHHAKIAKILGGEPS